VPGEETGEPEVVSDTRCVIAKDIEQQPTEEESA